MAQIKNTEQSAYRDAIDVLKKEFGLEDPNEKAVDYSKLPIDILFNKTNPNADALLTNELVRQNVPVPENLTTITTRAKQQKNLAEIKLADILSTYNKNKQGDSGFEPTKYIPEGQTDKWGPDFIRPDTPEFTDKQKEEYIPEIIANELQPKQKQIDYGNLSKSQLESIINLTGAVESEANYYSGNDAERFAREVEIRLHDVRPIVSGFKKYMVENKIDPDKLMSDPSLYFKAKESKSVPQVQNTPAPVADTGQLKTPSGLSYSIE